MQPILDTIPTDVNDISPVPLHERPELLQLREKLATQKAMVAFLTSENIELRRVARMAADDCETAKRDVVFWKAEFHKALKTL